MNNNEELKNEIEILKSKVKELTDFIEQKKSTQIKLPLDVISTNIIQKDLPVFKRKVTGVTTVGGYITCTINGLDFNILIK